MKHLLRVLLPAALLISLSAMAQTSPAGSSTPAAASAALPSAPSAAGSSPVATNPNATKMGTINIERAIFASNEGQRDVEALSKKLEPKQTELKSMNDELEGLKKQLNAQSDKLNDESRGTLVKQIDQKQKSFDRAMQDAREDAQNQQQEIASRILQKMAPLIVKYANDNGFGVIVDTSNPWPNGPVVWAGPAVDITEPVILAYNTQSGVPAPARPAGATPGAGTGTRPAGAPKPATPAAKPPASSAPKPPTTQPK
jgi:outer membrane protein